MSTTVARLACDEPTARRLADVLGESLDTSEAACAAFEDSDGQWRVAIYFGGAPDESAVRALVRLAAGDVLADALQFEKADGADWVLRSLRGLSPVRAGRFLVHGAHDRLRVKANDIAIEIEAALAFGTGHHGTTQACLMTLDALLKRERRTPIPPLKGKGRSGRALPRGLLRNRRRDKAILDIGTGSGVLAIAAAKVLRKRVIASDIDVVAVRAAAANAQLNGVGAYVAPLRATGAQSRRLTARAPYDLIFANILLGPVLRLAVPLQRLSRPGTWLVLSGFLPGQANAVLAIYRAQGFCLARRIVRDNWVTLLLRR